MSSNSTHERYLSGAIVCGTLTGREREQTVTTIKELRESKGWSQEDLGREAGVTSTTISRLENEHPVNRATLRHIARALGVNPNDITGVTFSQRVRRG